MLKYTLKKIWLLFLASCMIKDWSISDGVCLSNHIWANFCVCVWWGIGVTICHYIRGFEGDVAAIFTRSNSYIENLIIGLTPG